MVTSRAAVKAVPTLTGIVAIAANDSAAFALDAQGAVWAWGNNSNGELGNGGVSGISSVSVKVSGLSGITAVSADHHQAWAVQADGSTMRLGVNSPSQSPGPALQRYLSAACPARSVVSHGIGVNMLCVDASVWSTELGPLSQVAGLSGVTQLVVNGATTYALNGDRTLWAWGENFGATLGSGYMRDSGNGTSFQSLPAPVPGITGVQVLGVDRQSVHVVIL